jgi:hypothetical protein
MTMNRLELRMKYKAETAQSAESIDCSARIGRMGDVIIDGGGVDQFICDRIKQTASIEIPDPDYLEWLEEKLMELLSK